MEINSKAKNYLENSFRRGKNSHAYLFFGPKGNGKFEAAVDFVCLVNDIKGSEENVAEEKNPDVIVVAPEIEEKGDRIRKKDIVIDQIKEAVRKISYYSYNKSGKKFLIVREAEKMNNTAANSLLKLIEEPNEDTIIIMITSRLEDVLPTIQSRCQKIYFGPEENQVLIKYLQKKNPAKTEEEIKEAVELSWGRWKIAQEFLDDEEKFQEKKEMFNIFRKAIKGGWNEGLTLAESLSGNKEKLLEEMEQWIWQLREFLKKTVSENQDKQVQKKVFMMIKELLETKRRIEKTNVNPKLQLESFFIKMG